MIVALRIDSRRPYQIYPLLSISLVFLGAGPITHINESFDAFPRHVEYLGFAFYARYRLASFAHNSDAQSDIRYPTCTIFPLVMTRTQQAPNLRTRRTLSGCS